MPGSVLWSMNNQSTYQMPCSFHLVSSGLNLSVMPKCRQWQLCQQPYFGREQKPSLFSASHAISSLPKHQTAFLLITSAAWNHPEDSSVCWRPTWGWTGRYLGQTTARVQVGGAREKLALTTYPQVDSGGAGTHPVFWSESLIEFRKLVLDQCERKCSCLSFIDL